MISIINYGIGNLHAIKNIIQKVGGQAVITDDPEKIRASRKLILPGVGAFGYGMSQLQKRGLVDILNEEVLEKKKVVLGLCLGAQLITQHSDEDDVPGLGWIPGKTVKFDSAGLVIPHMGWADVNFSRTDGLWANLEEARFYFTHSYHFKFQKQEFVSGTVDYGYNFAAAFQYGNIMGVQFHPEKSHRYGMQLIKNFIEL
jgi:glutamine amidotransferase